MKISEFQEGIKKTYFAKDSQRGVAKTFMWFLEEAGELAREIRKDDRKGLAAEMGDCFAWLVSLANLLRIDLEKEAGRYSGGCPKCGKDVCECQN